MDLKYYLRGLGLGIIVTAIIMAVVSPNNQKMTDAEIIRRAKQLGLTEEKVLSDSTAKKEDAAADGDAVDKVDKKEEKEKEEQPQGNKNAVSAQAADRNAQNAQAAADRNAQNVQAAQTKPEVEIVNTDAEEPDASEVGEDRELERQEAEEADAAAPIADMPMEVTIGSGDGSYAASRKLADVGAVPSPEKFDTFLCENGYDKKIRPGTYMIPVGAGNERIARIITGEE